MVILLLFLQVQTEKQAKTENSSVKFVNKQVNMNLLNYRYKHIIKQCLKIIFSFCLLVHFMFLKYTSIEK